MNYYISVPIQALHQRQEIAKRLQKAYDQNGSAGCFQVLPVNEALHQVIFERSFEEDATYINYRAQDYGLTPEAAAVRQLVAELDIDATDKVLGPIKEALTKPGHPVVFCFMATFGIALKNALEEAVPS